MRSLNPILVTGGAGYLGSWIVKLLLQRGYHVRTTVHDLADRGKDQHLLHLRQDVNDGTLSVFEAELQKPGSFDEAMQGCEFVIHTASPFILDSIEDPQSELIDPAVQGTRNVLQTANRSPLVRRVVLTSSAAAIYGDSADEEMHHGPFTEEDWNTSSTLDHQPYAYSKTLAEHVAWEIARLQNRWDLVVLNPGFMIGPAVNPASSGVSNSMMKDLASGRFKHGMIDLWFGVVDVRDAAEAHLKACLSPVPQGRYIISGQDASLFEIASTLRKEFGDRYPIPTRKAPKALAWLMAPRFHLTRKFVMRNANIPVHLDNHRSIDTLGRVYHPISTAATEHFRQVISFNHN